MVTSTEPKQRRPSPQEVSESVSSDADGGGVAGDRRVVGVGRLDQGDGVVQVELLDDVRRPWWRWTAPSWTVVCAAAASTVPSSRPVPASTIWTGAPPSPRMSVRSAARSRRVQCQPVGPAAQQPAASSWGSSSAAAGPKSGEVVVGERQLRGGGAQVRGEDVGVVGVEDGGLDGLLEERLGVVDEEGVQRVVAGDQDRERALRRSARRGRPAATGRRGCRDSRR